MKEEELLLILFATYVFAVISAVCSYLYKLMLVKFTVKQRLERKWIYVRLDNPAFDSFVPFPWPLSLLFNFYVAQWNY